MSINAFLAGSTGLVGSNILSALVAHHSCSHTHAFTRRALPTQSPKLSTLPHSIFLSALGTTRAQAGGFDKQRAIDYDLNLDLARAAKAAGIKTYVLISSASASASSMFGYTKMKGELEDAVKALDFEHCIIVRPGLIVGARDDSRPAEFVLRKVAGLAGCFTDSLKDFWAQDAQVIARAAVSAGVQCAEGKREKGVWVLGQADIVKLGRTEWKEEEQK